MKMFLELHSVHIKDFLILEKSHTTLKKNLSDCSPFHLSVSMSEFLVALYIVFLCQQINLSYFSLGNLISPYSGKSAKRRLNNSGQVKTIGSLLGLKV